MLVHATGFCGAVLSPLAAHLSVHFRCVAIDLRAHGRSGAPADGDFDWHGFGIDVLGVIEALGLKSPAGFGHSCGGAALLLAEQAHPGLFSHLYCFEPIVYAAEPPVAPSLEDNPLCRGALRRRSSFASREEALANFSTKAPLDVLEPSVLLAYVDNGFAPDPSGGISLRCRREDEANVYAHSLSHDAFRRLGAIRCPVTLVCGANTDAMGPGSLARIASRIAHANTLCMPDLGHFGPLEDPAAVAESLRSSLGAGRDRGLGTITRTRT